MCSGLCGLLRWAHAVRNRFIIGAAGLLPGPHCGTWVLKHIRVLHYSWKKDQVIETGTCFFRIFSPFRSSLLYGGLGTWWAPGFGQLDGNTKANRG